MVERIRTLLESRQLTPTQFADLIGVARPIVSHILSGRNKPSLEVVQRILAAMPDLAKPWLLNGSCPMLATARPFVSETRPVATTPAPLPSANAAAAAAAAAAERASASQSFENQQNSPAQQEIFIPEPSAGAPVARLGVKVKGLKHAGRENNPSMLKAPAIPKRFVAKPAAVGVAAKPNQMEAREPVEPFLEVASEPAPSPTGPSAALPAPGLSDGLMPVGGPSIASVTGTVDNENQTANAAPTSAVAQSSFASAAKPIRRIVIFYRDGSFADYQPE